MNWDGINPPSPSPGCHATGCKHPGLQIMDNSIICNPGCLQIMDNSCLRCSEDTCLFDAEKVICFGWTGAGVAKLVSWLCVRLQTNHYLTAEQEKMKLKQWVKTRAQNFPLLWMSPAFYWSRKMARNCLSTLSSANSFMCNMSSRSQRRSRQCQIRHNSHLKSTPLCVIWIHWSHITMLFKLSRSDIIRAFSEGCVFVGCSSAVRKRSDVGRNL
jgi:hypothetical protein